MRSTKIGTSVEMDVLVCVKAYPSLSQTYREAVCVAGVRLDTPSPEWVRLFPVQFRDLPRDQRFRKYEVIRLRAHKHTTDTRAETWRPELDTIVPRQYLPPGGHWPARRRWVEPLIGPSMCELYRGRLKGGTGPSLGLVRPTRVCDVLVGESEDWTPGQRGIVGQESLLAERKSDLEKPAF